MSGQVLRIGPTLRLHLLEQTKPYNENIIVGLETDILKKFKCVSAWLRMVYKALITVTPAHS